MSKQPPPAPIASAIDPCPTTIQIVGRPGTGSLPRTIAPPDHPYFGAEYVGVCKHGYVPLSNLWNIVSKKILNSVMKIQNAQGHLD